MWETLVKNLKEKFLFMPCFKQSDIDSDFEKAEWNKIIINDKIQKDTYYFGDKKNLKAFAVRVKKDGSVALINVSWNENKKQETNIIISDSKLLASWTQTKYDDNSPASEKPKKVITFRYELYFTNVAPVLHYESSDNSATEEIQAIYNIAFNVYGSNDVDLITKFMTYANYVAKKNDKHNPNYQITVSYLKDLKGVVHSIKLNDQLVNIDLT